LVVSVSIITELTVFDGKLQSNYHTPASCPAKVSKTEAYNDHKSKK